MYRLGEMSLKGAARGILFLTLGLAANAGTLAAAGLHTQTFAAVKAALSPPNDAGFDAPVWQSALTLTDFYDFSLREPARHKTIARILYDDRNVYVGVSAEQFGVPITATQTVDNAGIGHDDRIIVQLDTSGKGQRHYEFSASAKGVRNEYSAENARYAPQWSTLARLRPTGGYNLLMVIPISDMRTSGRGGAELAIQRNPRHRGHERGVHVGVRADSKQLGLRAELAGAGRIAHLGTRRAAASAGGPVHAGERRKRSRSLSRRARLFQHA